MAETGVTHTVGDFRASDGYVLRYRRYPPPAPPRARVVGVHGIQSHGGWYELSCTRLAEAGFAVDFLDRRGSGLNPQARGDTPSFRRLLDDLAEFIRADGRPGRTFLMAISWGGKLAAALCRRHPGLVDGIALLCPGFFPRVRPRARERWAVLGARLVAPRMRFPIPLNDPALFTAVPRWRRFIAEDALSLREATARLLVESVRLDLYLRSVPRHVRVPVLLLLAGQDRIIGNDRTRAFTARFATADVEVREYPEAHHTLEFEPDPGPFIADLRDWLARHAPRATAGTLAKDSAKP